MKHHSEMTNEDVQRVTIWSKLLQARLDTHETFNMLDQIQTTDLDQIEKISDQKQRLLIVATNINLMLECI